MKKALLFSAVILFAAGCSNQPGMPYGQQPQSTSPTNSSVSEASPQMAGVPIYSGRPIYVGKLQISDNSVKGNLMLLAKPDERMAGGDLAKPATLYIKTQRDYSKLIGKKVLVAFAGYPTDNINHFGIIDIVEDTGQSSFFPK